MEDRIQYEIDNSVLEVVNCHKDLDVVVDTCLRFHCHVSELVHKATGLSSRLLWVTVNRSPEFVITLFVSHIRLIVAYSSKYWICWRFVIVENCAEKMDKNIDGMHCLTFGEKLKSLNVVSIKGRLTSNIKYGKIPCSDSEMLDSIRLF